MSMSSFRFQITIPAY